MPRARRKLRAGVAHPRFPSRNEEQVLNAGGIRSESFVYDFSSDGGAVGTVSVGRILPAGAIVKSVTADVQTAVTSGGAADYKVVAGSVDLVGSIDFDDATDGVDSVSVKEVSSLSGSASAIKISSDSELGFEIETAALTAGKVRFLVEYLLPND